MRESAYRWLVFAAFAAVLIIVTGNAAPLSTEATLSPGLTFLLSRTAEVAVPAVLSELGASQAPASDGGTLPRFGVLIRTSSVAALRQRGLEINTVVGDIVTAQLTLPQLRSVPHWPEVVFVEGPGELSLAVERADAVQGPAPLAPELKRSIIETGANQMHGRGLKGKDVVVGVVDTGVDWTHLDFRIDRDGDGIEEGSRLLGIWDQTIPGDRPDGFGYGAEFTRAVIEQALRSEDKEAIKQRDANPNAPNHGTHALGIAGGDGSSSGLRLVGMAPEAELVMVKSPLTLDKVIDGINYIFSVAAGRPAVASLSLGSHLGAHDGTSNFERALDALTQKPGRIIVVAAGNEGDDRIHVGGRLKTFDTESFTFDLPVDKTQSRFSFDFWYAPKPDPLEVTITGPNGSRIGPVPTGELIDTTLADGGVFIDNAHQGSNPNNGLNELLITVYGKIFGAKQPLQPGRWTITLTAPRQGTDYQGWALGVPFSSANANNESTIRIPATAKRAIAVGAYVTQTEWLGQGGVRQTFTTDNRVGEIAVFSSTGPTPDGRIKPDLVAPGSMVASSLSKDSINLIDPHYILADGVHAVNRGTSFAAPHVAGAVALLLQENMFLDAVQAITVLKDQAFRDEFTGFFPNNVWGSGKLELDPREPQPTPPVSVLGALDTDGDNVLGDAEMLSAIQVWIAGASLSSEVSVEITDATILWLITLWIQQAPLDELEA